MKPFKYFSDQICLLDHRQNPFAVTFQAISADQATPYAIMYSIEEPNSPGYSGTWHEFEPEKKTTLNRVGVIDFPIFAIMLSEYGNNRSVEMTVLQSGGGA